MTIANPPDYDPRIADFHEAVGRNAVRGAGLEVFTESLLKELDPAWQPRGAVWTYTAVSRIIDRILVSSRGHQLERRITDLAAEIRSVQVRRNVVIHSCWSPNRDLTRWRSEKPKPGHTDWQFEWLSVSDLHEIALECRRLQDAVLEVLNHMLRLDT